MIREFQQSDIDQVINIWLKASIEAHDFVDSSFWRSKAKDMREIYIPSGETYVYEDAGIIKGFVSLYQDTIAAMFVSPDSQRRGIGTKLMQKAKDVRHALTLAVYKENSKSTEFYKKCGFTIERKQIDKHTGHLELVMKYDS